MLKPHLRSSIQNTTTTALLQFQKPQIANVGSQLDDVVDGIIQGAWHVFQFDPDPQESGHLRVNGLHNGIRDGLILKKGIGIGCDLWLIPLLWDIKHLKPEARCHEMAGQVG